MLSLEIPRFAMCKLMVQICYFNDIPLLFRPPRGRQDVFCLWLLITGRDEQPHHHDGGTELLRPFHANTIYGLTGVPLQPTVLDLGQG
jgi:hypothetical protein